MARRKKIPGDVYVGDIGKDCLGEKKLTSPDITWKREAPGHYVTQPFRFILEKIEEDEYVVTHWKLSDCRPAATYHAKTAKELKTKAQEIVDVEQGRKPKPEPKKKTKKKRVKYEGLFVGGKKIDFETMKPYPEDEQPEDCKTPVKKRKGLFD